MSSLEPFIKAYHETVASDRMSSSRVDRIRTEAMLQFHQSSALMAAIVREHRQARGKTSLSSLYLFDAICRYARDVIRKQASGFDYKHAEAPRGSYAKRGTKKALVEGAEDFAESSAKAVDDVITATLDEIREDQKDKVAKVVEIWRKAGTFDDDTVHRLHRQIRSGSTHGTQDDRRSRHDSHDDTAHPSETRQDDRDARSTSAQAIQEAAASKAASMPNVPSNILAMLGGSDRNKEIKQDTPNDEGRSAEVKSLDPAQLDALKRFASLAKSGTEQTPERGDSAKHESTSLAPPPSQAPGGPPVHPDRLKQLNGEVSNGSSASAQFQQSSATPENRQGSTGNDTTKPPPPPPPQSSSVAGFVPDQSVGDLSQFDFSTFDPASPASWLIFAQQWHNTYQYVPTNQDLFNGLVSGMQAQMYMQAQQMMAPGGQDGSQNTNNDMYATNQGASSQQQYW